MLKFCRCIKGGLNELEWCCCVSICAQEMAALSRQLHDGKEESEYCFTVNQ